MMQDARDTSATAQEWIIDEAYQGKRLDHFLCAMMPSSSRSAIQQTIRNGEVFVNQKVSSVHRFLRLRDRVSWLLPPKMTQQTSEPSSIPPLQIIHETTDWIIVYKPAGLLVHPDSKTQTGTLIDALIDHAPQIASIGEDPRRPGLVHRLDRDTSGLLVVAKTQDAFDDLKRQFASHSVKKIYLALVHGVVAQDEGDIKFRIARSTTRPRMAARPAHESAGKASWTHYRVLSRAAHHTLVELDLLSGRTHQIRAHLHGIGHPLVGDSLYTSHTHRIKKTKTRLMLQNIELAFDDPRTHERRSFTINPDQTFREIMNTLL